MSPLHRPQQCTSSGDDILMSLTTALDDSFSQLDPEQPGHLIGVTMMDDTEELELNLLPLEPGDHPADVMAGFTAPPEWTAVGVVTAGRSHEPTGPPRPIRLTFVLDRSGAAITLLTPTDSPRAQRRTLREPPVGLVADACRRVLGLATAPPTEGPEIWLTARWLDRLLAVAIDEPGALATWEAAAALHPLLLDGEAPAPEALADLVDRVAGDFDWERLRLVAARDRAGGADPAGHAVSPSTAAWMDAGSFARHVLAAELPVDVLFTELDGLIAPSLSEAVRNALPRSCRSATC